MAKFPMTSYNVRDLTRDAAYADSKYIGQLWDELAARDAEARARRAAEAEAKPEAGSET